MDHSYADQDETDDKATVEGPADEDHNYISEGKKLKIKTEPEDEKSEDTDSSGKMIIALSPETNPEKKEKSVDQNQNTHVLCDKEAKKGEKNEEAENTNNTKRNGRKEKAEINSDKETEKNNGDNSMLVDDEQADSSLLNSTQTTVTEDSMSNSICDSSQLDEDEEEDDSIEALISNVDKYTAKLDMETLTRPFKEGWKREVVQRNVFQKYSESGKKKNIPIDIYYFTPEGKKLRSMIQITDYINKTTGPKLPLECFCFMRKPIYREPFEIVRSAGKSRRPLDTYSKSPSPVIKRGRPAKVNRMSPKIATKPARTRSKIPEPEVVIDRDGDGDGEHEFCVSSYLEMAVHGTKKRPYEETEKKPDVPDDVSSEPPVKKKATARKSTTARPNQTIKQSAPVIDGSRSEGQLCTINCPGLEGQPPVLQCSVCMCLFHPKCVNVPDNNIPPVFSCLRCKGPPGRSTSNGNTEKLAANSYLNFPSGNSTVTVVFPNRTVTTTAPTSTVSTSVNSTIRSFLSNKSPQPLRSPTKLTAPEIPPLPPLKPAHCSTPRMLLSSSNKTLVSIAPPKLTAAPGTIPLPPPPPLPPLIMQPTPKIGTSPQTPVVVQKPTKETPVNAQLLTLPGAVTKRLNLSQPLALKINNVHIVVPPNCVINSKEGLKVVLPPNTFGLPVDPNAKLNVTVSNNSGGMETFKSVPESTVTSDKIIEKTTYSASDNIKSGATKIKTKSTAGINPSQCFVKSLFGGYECMLSIFRNLTTYDLLRAGQVCKTWHHISRQPSLWRVVRLKDMKIPDWETATKFMRQVAVEKLSLKGLHHYDDRNRTWHMLMASLHNLVALRDIQFGLVPATVLHSVCEKLQSLEVFSAEFISDMNSEQMWNTPTKIDVAKFATLQHLKELRLRGVGGLVLPTFSSINALSDITALKQLEVLSLTTLRSFQDSEFHFLSRMQKLVTLEIGDCSPWTESYSRLGKLTNLKRLRLECGGDLKNTNFAEALIHIKGLRELELVMFVIPDNLADVMGDLENLHKFIVWPDASNVDDIDKTKSAAQNNTNVLNTLSKLKKLEYLEWGIITNTEPCSSLSSDMNIELKFNPGQFDTDSISIQKLTEKLCNIMPDTEKIRVFKTQALSHTRYKNKES